MINSLTFRVIILLVLLDEQPGFQSNTEVGAERVGKSLVYRASMDMWEGQRVP